MQVDLPGYAELYCISNFTFLRGASHPEELVRRAQALGYAALAITDECSLAGVVRAHVAARECGLKLLIGTEIIIDQQMRLVLIASNRESYGHLSTLISRGRRQSAKGSYHLTRKDLETNLDHCLAILLPGTDVREEEAQFIARRFPGNAWIGVEMLRGPDDQARLQCLKTMGRRCDLPLVATGGVYMHLRSRKPLQDTLTAIRLRTTLQGAGQALEHNAERHLRSRLRLAQIYCAPLLAETLRIAERCDFSLDSLRYEYPDETVPPGETSTSCLRRLTLAGLQQRLDLREREKIRDLVEKELSLIAELGYEHFFLTVHDIVRFARSRGILCQGRGSAANSAVCYCLGITEVDPSRMDLLFERFISRERAEPPDIDVDFEHQRREEVIQYIYAKYGRDRAALAATLVTYQPRSALRDAGRAMGLDSILIDRMSKSMSWWDGTRIIPERLREAGIDTESSVTRKTILLAAGLIGFPRHLSQHVGGFVISGGPLARLVPVENAAMPGRSVIQWDKDDLESLGLLKVDVLALGMLSAIRRTLDFVNNLRGSALTMKKIIAGGDDPAVYRLLQRADTVGVFQVESRAQMSMLPRLRPQRFYDLVVQIAIVRPGPIQGGMVHPYLRRRSGHETVDYPSEEIRGVLERTLGVPIFQEQVMRLAIVAAGFTPGEADQLRRSMAAWKRRGGLGHFRDRLVHGMRKRGYKPEFAEQIFRQICGFGEYGFPESHAASFALLVYVSAWIKCHYPAVFCAALLNSQPLGFYAPAQLVQDAQRHGVTVAGVDVNHSDWESTLEPLSGAIRKPGGRRWQREYQLRLGLHQVQGIPEELARRIVAHRRQGGRYLDVNQLQQRTGIGQGLLTKLAEAGALNSLSGHRRAAMWQSLAQERTAGKLTLLESTGADEDEAIPEPLRPLTPQEEVFTDYQTTGLSLRGHPLSFYRNFLNTRRIKTASQLPSLRHGQYVAVAGMVLLRQRPGTAKGITFVTLEDETGSINLVIKVEIWERFYKIAKQSNMWLAHGVLENRNGVIHVVVGRLEDMSDIVPLQNPSRDFR